MSAGCWRRAVRGLFIFVLLGATFSAPPAHAALCDLLGTCKPRPPQCADGKDNDRDGVVDLRDPGCTASKDTWEGDDLAPDLGTAVTGALPAGKWLGFNTSLALWDSGVTGPQEVALLQRAGGSMQRFAIPWRGIQPHGPGPLENLSEFDALYRDLVAGGVRPVIDVLGAPAWAACKLLELKCRSAINRDHRNLPPRWDHISSYASVVAALARRYPAAVIETWNEPNYRTYWDTADFADPARMAHMQCAAYQAVKQVNPRQIVSSPGLLWIESYRSDDGRGAGLLEYLKGLYANTGRVCWDVLSVHLYPARSYDGPNSQPAKLLRLLRNIRPGYGDETPVWIGEVGATTSGSATGSHQAFSEVEQAAIVDGVIGELFAAPEVEAVLVHALRDRGHQQDTWSSPHYGFGLLREAAGASPPPKVAYCLLVARAGSSYPGC